MPIFDKDIALDMGTTRVMLYLRGKGVALREPTLTAVDKFTGKLLRYVLMLLALEGVVSLVVSI